MFLLIPLLIFRSIPSATAFLLASKNKLELFVDQTFELETKFCLLRGFTVTLLAVHFSGLIYVGKKTIKSRRGKLAFMGRMLNVFHKPLVHLNAFFYADKPLNLSPRDQSQVLPTAIWRSRNRNGRHSKRLTLLKSYNHFSLMSNSEALLHEQEFL